MQLQNKIAIVTGAARGIGLGVARAFAAEGAAVVLADVNRELGQAEAERLPEAAFIPCDVGDAEQVSHVVAETMRRFGRIDICVNNAGIIRAADILDVTEADFDAVLRVNLKGAFLMARATAREMVNQDGGGSIINMSSVNGVMAIPNQLPYNVSKGGLDQLTRVMAVALAGRGVRVNAIGPGSIMTDMLKTVMTDAAARRTILSRTPMGRCGEVEEIARIAVFLASDESAFVTGADIKVDGGLCTLPRYL